MVSIFGYRRSYGLRLAWLVAGGGLVLVGILCLLAAVLFTIGSPSAWSVFKTGVSLVPLLLFTNLILLLVRVLQELLQGNGFSLLSRLYASPLNKAIVIVVIVLALLSALKELRKS